MTELDFRVASMRFQLDKENRLLVFGTFCDDNPEGRELEFYLDGEKLSAEQTLEEGIQIRKKYLGLHQNINQEIIAGINLPDNWREKHKFEIRNILDGHTSGIYKMSVRQLMHLQGELSANMEFCRREDDKIIITGWAMDTQPIDVEVIVNGKKIPCDVTWKYRKDVQDFFIELEEEKKAGYEIVFDSNVHRAVIRLVSGSKSKVFHVSANQLKNGGNSLQELGILAKAWGYFKKYGFRKTLMKTMDRLRGKKSSVDYETFLQKYATTPEQLEEQRKEKFAVSPKFSIAVPLYNTKEKFLSELIESVQAQTYDNWELCFADGSETGKNLQNFVRRYQEKDCRIKYQLLDGNLGIAGNTNAALKTVTGDFVVLADHDDLLAPDALYECVKAVNGDSKIDVLYSDEDKVDWDGKKYFEPHFKSDFNIDLLCSMNYICHLFVFRRDILDKAGGFESCYDGAQDHDFIFRCVEQAECIYHIPKVLYHWRCHRQSTSENPESKLYAFANGCKAVQAHYNRIGIPATVEQGPFYGMYRTRYHWDQKPLVSILIPNKDHIADLKKCMDSIDEKSSYENYEFVIIENNSTEQESFEYYRELEKRENVTVLYYDGDFNYSRINNFGAAHARGDYLLLLNNDTEMIDSDGIKEMLDICMREDVAIVGARLFYEDDTIQHAGVIIGFGGMAGHAFIGQDRSDNGYFSRILCVQDLSAVTAACLMVKKSAFQSVGGLSEEFKVAFNDIDFCLKVRKMGMLVVYDPYATFYHYESKSRGLEDSAEKIERFNREAALLCERWPDIMENGDPYYNPNLTLDKADFSLKE